MGKGYKGIAGGVGGEWRRSGSGAQKDIKDSRGIGENENWWDWGGLVRIGGIGEDWGGLGRIGSTKPYKGIGQGRVKKGYKDAVG